MTHGVNVSQRADETDQCTALVSGNNDISNALGPSCQNRLQSLLRVRLKRPIDAAVCEYCTPVRSLLAARVAK